MNFTIYKTTNLINGKFYIGKHQAHDINDSYYGSGKGIKAAIKKYGKKNFKKEVLFVFDNEEDMNFKEIELITEEFVSRKDTYNAGIGGEGGPHFKGKTHSKEVRKILSDKGKQRKPISEETREKIREGNRKRTISDETKRKISIKAFEREERKRQAKFH